MECPFNVKNKRDYAHFTLLQIPLHLWSERFGLNSCLWKTGKAQSAQTDRLAQTDGLL